MKSKINNKIWLITNLNLLLELKNNKEIKLLKKLEFKSNFDAKNGLLSRKISK